MNRLLAQNSIFCWFYLFLFPLIWCIFFYFIWLYQNKYHRSTVEKVAALWVPSMCVFVYVYRIYVVSILTVSMVEFYRKCIVFVSVWLIVCVCIRGVSFLFRFFFSFGVSKHHFFVCTSYVDFIYSASVNIFPSICVVHNVSPTCVTQQYF